MKEELMQLGFTEMNSPKGFVSSWLELKKNGFRIYASPEGYFNIYTDESGDREAAPYPYRGVEKLKELITAHEEYFN